jgi:hypothetical protein
LEICEAGILLIDISFKKALLLLAVPRRTTYIGTYAVRDIPCPPRQERGDGFYHDLI